MIKIISITLANLHLNPFTRLNYGNLNLIQDAICYNQGKLAEYICSASEKHKRVKNELAKLTIQEEKKIKALANLKKYSQELDEYLNDELKNICTENFTRILRYFENRSYIRPRVCIKGYNNGNIVPLFRDCTLIPNEEYPVSENTAFEYIYHTGSYYHCDDIPSEYKERKYKNARIIEDNAFRYKSPGWIKRQISKYFNNQVDKNWINCWKSPIMHGGDKIDPPAEVCYKSTLVIPMTLYNNTLSMDLKKRFDIHGEVSPKTIYGFLCFDSHVSDFFKKKQDISVGYIFADILSLYLINKLIYTEYSSTYKKTMAMIHKNK